MSTPKRTHQTRYIPFTPADPTTFDLQSARQEILDALRRGIQRVHRHPSQRVDVYVGNGGTVLTDWLVSTIPEPDLSSSFTPFPIPEPGTYTDISAGANSAFLATSVGSATLFLLNELRNSTQTPLPIPSIPSIPSTQSDSSSSEGTNLNLKSDVGRCVEVISKAVQVSVNEKLDVLGDGCEVLFGRAGLLYALLKLRSEFHGYSLQLDQQSPSPHQSQRSTEHHRDPDPDTDKHKYIVESVRELSSDQQIKLVFDDLVARGKEGAITYAEELSEGREKQKAPGLMWSWRGKRYLGGAHGVAGILQMLVSSPQSILAPHWDVIVSTVSWLVDIQLPSGNWPTKAEKHMFRKVEEDERDMLVQWCHGAPAMLILFSTLLRRFGHDTPSVSTTPTSNSELALSTTLISSLKQSLTLGANLVYTHGLLRKGIGLCHGVSGSVYTLLSVFDAFTSLQVPSSPSPSNSPDLSTQTNTTPHLLHAIHLAHLATSYESLTRTQGEMYIPDRPYSLFEGVAGMCCAWVEVLRRLDGLSSPSVAPGGNERQDRYVGRGMPAYDDFGWVD